MKRALLIFAFFAIFLTSCSISYYKQPLLASTKAAAIPKHKVLGAVKKEKCEWVFFFFSKPIDFKSMYASVLDESQSMGGDAVLDFQVRKKSFTFIYPLFYASQCYTVAGTAIKFTGAGSAWDDAPAGSSAWDGEAKIEEKKTDTKSSWD